MKPDYKNRYLERLPERVRQSGLSRHRRDEELVELIRQGPLIWNEWRERKWETDSRAQFPSLFEADLRSLDLSGINLFNADLEYACLRRCKLHGANLQRADLTGANLRRANLTDAEMRLASFVSADLTGANLSRSVLALANFTDADLSWANLSECMIYGLSAWNVTLRHTIQKDLLVTTIHDATLTTDQLETAAVLHLFMTNASLATAIDTFTGKLVLILGRFTPERKSVLNAIRNDLRNRDYLPVLFDFDKPLTRDLTETVSILAHMARFVIADITDAKSIPQELMAIVPNLPSVPVQPLLLASADEYGMFERFKRYPWVLPAFFYEDQDSLLAALTEKVIEPAEKKVREQTER